MEGFKFKIEEDIIEELKNKLINRYGFRVDYIISIEGIYEDSLDKEDINLISINKEDNILDYHQLINWLDNILDKEIYEPYRLELFECGLYKSLYYFDDEIKEMMTERIEVILKYHKEKNRNNPFYQGVGVDDIYSDDYSLEFIHLYKKLF